MTKQTAHMKPLTNRELQQRIGLGTVSRKTRVCVWGGGGEGKGRGDGGGEEGGAGCGDMGWIYLKYFCHFYKDDNFVTSCMFSCTSSPPELLSFAHIA